MESCHEVSLLLSPFSLIFLHALLFRLFMSGFWWNYSIASLYNRNRTRGLLGYVMYLFEFLVSYRSSFLLLTNDLNLFNLSIRCSINFRLHKSLHDSRESEGRIPLQILNFKSQLKSQVNAIRATTIFLWLKGTIDGLSDRAFDRLNGTSWITEERFAPGTSIATTYAVSPTLLSRHGFENTFLSSVRENWLLDVDGDPWVYMEHVNAFY